MRAAIRNRAQLGGCAAESEYPFFARAAPGPGNRDRERRLLRMPAARLHRIGQRAEQRRRFGDPETAPFAVVQERDGAEIDLDGGEDDAETRHRRAFRRCSYPPGLSRGPPGRFVIRATLEHGVGVRPVGALPAGQDDRIS